MSRLVRPAVENRSIAQWNHVSGQHMEQRRTKHGPSSMVQDAGAEVSSPSGPQGRDAKVMMLKSKTSASREKISGLYLFMWYILPSSEPFCPWDSGVKPSQGAPAPLVQVEDVIPAVSSRLFSENGCTYKPLKQGRKSEIPPEAFNPFSPQRIVSLRQLPGRVRL